MEYGAPDKVLFSSGITPPRNREFITGLGFPIALSRGAHGVARGAPLPAPEDRLDQVPCCFPRGSIFS
jgi:hypothetical protein